jgi:hypothetical protein
VSTPVNVLVLSLHSAASYLVFPALHSVVLSVVALPIHCIAFNSMADQLMNNLMKD